jgi:hypothetical protein
MLEFLLEAGGGRAGPGGGLEGHLRTVRQLGLAVEKLSRIQERERRALQQLRAGLEGLRAGLARGMGDRPTGERL